MCYTTHFNSEIIMKALDITGRKFARLTAIEVVRENNTRKWRCICECGNEIRVVVSVLLNGNTKSCGCLQVDKVTTRNFIHGKAKTSTYYTWASMRDRCSNPKSKGWKRYGGRGIKVCARWEKYSNFLEDMGERVSTEHSIDRIDNNGNYEPSNCRWAIRTVQQNNTSTNKYITAFGETKTIAEWCRDSRCSISQAALYKRIKNGIPSEIAITTKTRSPNRCSKHIENNPHIYGVNTE